MNYEYEQVQIAEERRGRHLFVASEITAMKNQQWFMIQSFLLVYGGIVGFNKIMLDKINDREPNYVGFQILDATGKRTYHNSWVTDLEVNEGNVREVVKGAHARWKIENEGFNTLKNQEYHLEHNFGHRYKNLSEAFFVLNLLAFFVHQILELTDWLYQSCRAGFSARKEFWNAIRASFRGCCLIRGNRYYCG